MIVRIESKIVLEVNDGDEVAKLLADLKTRSDHPQITIEQQQVVGLDGTLSPWIVTIVDREPVQLELPVDERFVL